MNLDWLGWAALIGLIAIPPSLYPYLCSLAATIAHTLAEMIGVRRKMYDGSIRREPFWVYSEGLTGYRICDRFGYFLFVGLGLSLITVSTLGYVYDQKWALALLFGLRFADAILSHALLALVYKAPNPGYLTSTLYLAECYYLFTRYELPFWWTVVGFMIFAGFWLLCAARLIRIRLRDLRHRRTGA